MPVLHSVRISKATRSYYCLYCRAFCPPGSRIGGYRGAHVCEEHIEWLKNTPVQPPKTVREEESRSRRVTRCKVCGASTGYYGESLCRDCIDMQKYVPIFTVRMLPKDKNIGGILRAMMDYEGRMDW